MRLNDYVTEASKPELRDGEYAIPFTKKEKVRDLNPRTNRMKNFKRMRYFKTDIKPEDRSFKNLPRYADKKSKCTFQQWLGIKGNPGKGTDGKWYGYSHRAVWGFGVGDTIKPDHIGNKYQYGTDINKEYNRLYNLDIKNGTDEADKYLKELGKFDPYTIKDEEDAKNHAIRFMRDVS